ncbi:Nicotinate dehydrogenase large molybdopterin subunit [Thalassovita gelatinovora]|uniref:Nicotinate dehydrogenase large molybdopterin subunit n=1 Tax=Thalassovita gelatinovora TaxID=53501 RepID=A0A0P1FBB5_THAGE|nr:molybdopterin cofactor-binding domain-containing protein [Thalassovita gelatinovora]QIZ80068.1 xanthine dehydrogenase family protein molybdopterin-binding subunit [Thalassovita gelatinovora]CUH65481.1 Nicotinate dehydrogenase large molybdopterin subunit [Thalassovita gelatinovora]SER08968.1 CO or xanthine dehydrogenase, Mo-binding subunit [Thalassovita gelatinovora]
MDFRETVTGAAVTRRAFLKSTGAGVALTVIAAPLGLTGRAGRAEGAGLGAGSTAVPGVARQRIDGLAKVTGQKVYARDFSAADMAGWPDNQWHALYLRALTTDQAFEGVDLGNLPPQAQPVRVVLGNELSQAQRAPKVAFTRDLHMDERMAQEIAKAQRKSTVDADGRSFNLPPDVVFDLIVVPGNIPNFLGQAVALLLFDSVAAFRAAKAAIEFNDDAFQIYGSGLRDGPPLGDAFSPTTTYVKYGDEFSYATADPETYMDQVPGYQSKIQQVLDSDPGLIRQPFSTDMQAMDPMFMEPEAGLVWIDGPAGVINIVLGTQSPDGDISNILSMYDSDDAPFHLRAVNLTSCYPGGGFGGRDSSPFTLMLALAGAYSGGNPVRLAYDRFEQFRVGLKRHGAVLTGALAIDGNMSLQAIQMTLTFDGGGRRNLSPYVASLAALCAGGSYAVPMADIFAEATHTQNISGGSQRGFGGPQAFFAIETALDDIAAGQNWDPVELRRANIVAEGGATVVGGPVEQSLRLAEMLDLAENHPLWADRAALKRESTVEGQTCYGTGLAMSLQAYGTSGDGMVASVFLNRDGTITVQSDAVDMGNGSATTLGVTIGPILGSNAAQVDMGAYTLFGMTGLSTEDSTGQGWDNPHWTAKSVGSSSACLTALHQVHTVRQTAEALFQGSVLVAATRIWGLSGLTPDEVSWQDGLLVLNAGGVVPLKLSQLADEIYAAGLPCGALGHAYFQNTWAAAIYPTPAGLVPLQLDGVSFYLPDGSDPVFVERQATSGPDSTSTRYGRYVWAPCVNVVALSVDITTGAVQIENVLSVLNAGHIHVPQLVSGQSQGGVAMAISYTLFEDMPPGMAGPANGSWNLNQYHLARAGDVPLVDGYAPGQRGQQLITLAELPGSPPVGRGIAEAVMCSVPPAISNALRDATGMRFASLPITPEKILKGLGQ